MRVQLGISCQLICWWRHSTPPSLLSAVTYRKLGSEIHGALPICVLAEIDALDIQLQGRGDLCLLCLKRELTPPLDLTDSVAIDPGPSRKFGLRPAASFADLFKSHSEFPRGR